MDLHKRPEAFSELPCGRTGLALRPSPAFSADCCSQQDGLLPHRLQKGPIHNNRCLEGRAEAEESSGLAALVLGVGNQGLAHSEVKPLKP